MYQNIKLVWDGDSKKKEFDRTVLNIYGSSGYDRKRIRKNSPKRRRAEDLILRDSIDSLKLRC